MQFWGKTESLRLPSGVALEKLTKSHPGPCRSRARRHVTEQNQGTPPEKGSPGDSCSPGIHHCGPLLWFLCSPLVLSGRYFSFSLFSFILFLFSSSFSNLGHPASHASQYIECDEGKWLFLYFLGHQAKQRHIWIWLRVQPGTGNSRLCEACSGWGGLWGGPGLWVLSN